MEARERALADNYAAFEQLLPKLLESDAGRFALLHNRQLIGLYDGAGFAHAAGKSRFDDGLFSVQKVKEGTISLGFFSYARYCRAT